MRKGLRITGSLVQLLLLAKAVAVAVTAPEAVWPASEPAGSVGLLAMYLSIGVAVLCTGGGWLLAARGHLCSPAAGLSCLQALAPACCCMKQLAATSTSLQQHATACSSKASTKCFARPGWLHDTPGAALALLCGARALPAPLLRDAALESSCSACALQHWR